EEKPGLIIGECVGLVEALVLFGHHFPQVQVLLWTGRFRRLPSAGVGTGEQIEQLVFDEPGKRYQFVLWIVAFQQKRGAAVKTNQARDLFSRGDVAVEAAEHIARNALPLDRVLG